jgi:phosphotransacetylase
VPVLVAPLAKLNEVAQLAQLDISGIEVIDVPHSHAAAEKAVAMAAAGEVEALMKGSLHTDELMGAVVHCPHCVPSADFLMFFTLMFPCITRCCY